MVSGWAVPGSLRGCPTAFSGLGLPSCQVKKPEKPEARWRKGFAFVLAPGLALRGSRRLKALRRSLQSTQSKVALDEFEALDANGDGVITREEFMAGKGVKEDIDASLNDFKEFLLENEASGPLWYRLADFVMTALGTVCFVLSVVQPQVAAGYHLSEVEDIVNVSFFVKFILLLWIRDFEAAWIFTGKGALDMASWLPVLDIPARFFGGPGLARATDLLQIGRFLRLLRDALPTKESPTKLPLGQQIIAVLLSLLGTVVISATVLFSYENPVDQQLQERSFEDSLVYMVNIFAGRDPPWYPVQPKAKLASVVATCAGIIFIPFLISRTIDIFMSPFGKDMEKDTEEVSGWVFSDWIPVLQRLDMLDEAGIITPSTAKQLRQLCLMQDEQLKMLDLCYGEACSSGEEAARQLYAARLRELLPESSPEVLSGDSSY